MEVTSLLKTPRLAVLLVTITTGIKLTDPCLHMFCFIAFIPMFLFS